MLAGANSSASLTNWLETRENGENGESEKEAISRSFGKYDFLN